MQSQNSVSLQEVLNGSPSAAHSISVVVPVYNSESTLSELISRIGTVLPAIAQPFEVVLVNDGSRDHSWSVIEQLATAYPWVRGINLMRNYGQHNALLAGIRSACHDITVTMDDDLQNPPEEIPRLLAELDCGYDVVYGAPQREQHGLFRDLSSQITKMVLQTSMGVDTARNISAFRAFRTPVREAFAAFRGPYASVDVLLTWATTRFMSIPVRHDPRHAGVSQYTFRKLVIHATNMVTGFSTLPLELASILGFASTLFGILILLYVLGRYLIEGGSVAGFPFLASIIAIFSGVQLFALGIFGEYLARIHFKTLDKPTYVVRSTTRPGSEATR